MKKIILFTCILLLGRLSLTGQSFWKTLGNETGAAALHSGILYLPQPHAFFVSTYNMGVFRSANLGTSWEHVLDLPKDQPLFSLFASEKGTVFCGGKEKIYRSSTNGDKWEEIPLNLASVNKFAKDKNGHLYICSNYMGGILKSENDGLSWTEYTNGLPYNYINGLLSDVNGNIFCSQLEHDGSYGGFYYRDELQDRWVKKDIKINIGDTEYVIKVMEIKTMECTPAGEIIVSMSGIASNFLVSGLFKNSVTGAINMTTWEMEHWEDSANTPFSLVVNDLFPTSNGHIFASRVSESSAGIYSKMDYSRKWIACNEGIPKMSHVNSYFCEAPDGTVYVTMDYSNKIYVTRETIPGKKYYKISYTPLQPMKLYEFQTLQATSGSGLEVKFKSMDNKTSIDGNSVRATGIGSTTVKAFTDANDSLYYSEESILLSVDKAENNIILEDPGLIHEGDTAIYLTAHSDSGEEVLFKMIRGNAVIVKNKLEINNPGKILFIATEQGNGSYEIADTLWMEMCIYPKKPIITADTLSGTIRLASSSDSNNYWYLNSNISGYAGKMINPGKSGIYTLQVVAEGCSSEFSEPYNFVPTHAEHILNRELSVFPIPFHDKLFIKKKANTGSMLKIHYSVLDLTGKVLLSNASGEDLITLDLSLLLPGWYILKLNRDQNEDRIKILKSR